MMVVRDFGIWNMEFGIRSYFVLSLVLFQALPARYGCPLFFQADIAALPPMLIDVIETMIVDALYHVL